MSKYKVGDKVRRVFKDSIGAEIHVITSVDEGSTYPYTLDDYVIAGVHFKDSELKRAEKTWDTLEIDDVIYLKHNKTKYRVLDVMKNTFIAINSRAPLTTGIERTPFVGRKDAWKASGWKIEGADEDKTTELTLEEIAKKFKIPVDKLRIKD